MMLGDLQINRGKVVDSKEGHDFGVNNKERIWIFLFFIWLVKIGQPVDLEPFSKFKAHDHKSF